MAQESSFLTVPNPISRSTSRESFATDASIVSLNSFTSDSTAATARPRHLVVTEDDFNTAGKSAQIARYRKDVLERMLESRTFALPKLSAKSGRNMGKSRAGKTDANLTESDEELLDECCNENGCERLPGTLYKSFSTTDLFNLTGDPVLRRATSQTIILSGFVLVHHCRKTHLLELQNLDSKALRSACNDFYLTTPSETPESYLENLSFCSLRKVDTDCGSPMQHNSSTQEQSVAKNPVSRGLQFSKEIGRQIRDDFFSKLAEQKQKFSTKFDIDKDKGRPVTRKERNFMIFHWLQSVQEDGSDST